LHGISGVLQAYAQNLLWHGKPRALAFYHSSFTFAKQSFKLYGVISKSEDENTSLIIEAIAKDI
jgi:rRNA maturation protein Rpf1